MPKDAVLYSLGISTNPYGHSSPRGFGIATGVAGGKLQRTEVRSREYGSFGGADWLGNRRVLVGRHAPPLRSPALFAYREGRLRRVGVAPFPGGSIYAWSPDLKRVAFEPPAPCRSHQRSLYRCYKGSGRIFVAGRGQVAKGVFGGWTGNGRFAYYPNNKAYARGAATIIDLDTGARRQKRHYWADQQPIRSADGRFLATLRGVEATRAGQDHRVRDGLSRPRR